MDLSFDTYLKQYNLYDVGKMLKVSVADRANIVMIMLYINNIQFLHFMGANGLLYGINLLDHGYYDVANHLDYPTAANFTWCGGDEFPISLSYIVMRNIRDYNVDAICIQLMMLSPISHNMHGILIMEVDEFGYESTPFTVLMQMLCMHNISILQKTQIHNMMQSLFTSNVIDSVCYVQDGVSRCGLEAACVLQITPLVKQFLSTCTYDIGVVDDILSRISEYYNEFNITNSIIIEALQCVCGIAA